jgi:hypothetical protein
MLRFLSRLLACAALLCVAVSFGGCQFLPGGSFWSDGHRDYINHDPTQPGT